MNNIDKIEKSKGTVLDTALKYARENRHIALDELLAFLRIPSVGTQPERKADTKDAAAWLAERMRLAGIENIKLIPTNGHSLVYGDWLGAGTNAATVLIYGHYDVQPADPISLWETAPFEPTVINNYIYGRGSADDKGQLYIHIKSVEAYLKSLGRLPVNVKFIIEGEEESGGEGLAGFVPGNSDLLAADVALISDTHILAPDRPAMVYGLRGICYIYLNIFGPDHDLHSGSYGGGVNNPINALGHIIAQLKDQDGHILIPGFYDKVRPLSEEERNLMAKIPFKNSSFLQEAGINHAWGEPEFLLIERLKARPTLDINGINGGYTGSGAKTVLPSNVHAKVSMRLVPDQDPTEIFQLFRNYVETITPPSVSAEVVYVHGAPASLIDFEVPAMQAAARSYERVFGRAPVFMREGGSLPVVSLFKRYLGLETVLMGFGLPDDRIHSPNERFYLPNFFRGIETAIHFLTEFSDLQSEI